MGQVLGFEKVVSRMEATDPRSGAREVRGGGAYKGYTKLHGNNIRN